MMRTADQQPAMPGALYPGKSGSLRSQGRMKRTSRLKIHRASDTVFYLPSASVLKTTTGGQYPHSRHPCRARQEHSCRPLPFGGVMTKMALFLFGFLVLTIGIGLLATISPV
ncbi:hypothetical protein F0170_09865 [Pseudomonas sp. MAFF 730085]|uniref:Uncharacterized protein n=1 Tax=Pseudomonas kitaguniensis TaxID=2607908 RepID=A0A5N7JS91_9PSED|nr:hypothetical protein [Pseudomonas kitaguniensis]